MTALRFAVIGWVVNVALALWHYFVIDLRYVESMPEAERANARYHCRLGQVYLCVVLCVVPWFHFAMNVIILAWIAWRLLCGPGEDSEDSAL